MAVESQSTFRLTLEGDGSGLSAVMAAFKRNFTSTVSDIERSTQNIKLFSTLDTDLKKSAQSLDFTRAAVASLTRTIETLRDAGEPIGKDLERGLKVAERAARDAEREFVRQSQAVDKLRTSLTAAGVDVTNLARAEQQLAVRAREAAAAEQQRQAAATLGIRTSREQTAELARLRAAYDTIRASGTATFADLQAAAAAYHRRTAEVAAGTNDLVGSFEAARLRVLGFIAAIGGAAATFRELAGLAVDNEKRVAQFGATSNLTGAQVKVLTDGLRELAQTAGFDVKEGFEQMQALLRQGVPAGNVLEVLEKADGAAKAAVTSLGTASEVAGLLIRGFGVNASNVGPALDKLFAVMKAGGPNFEEFRSGLGSIAPLAKATGTSLDDVAAMLLVLSQSGVPAGEAMGTVTQILTRLGSPEVRQGLRGLGIEATGAMDVLRALADRGLPLQEILGLEISSRRAAAGIAALTGDSSRLTAALQTVASSAGSINLVNEALNQTRSEALERLVAALDALKTNLGAIVLPSAQTIQNLTELVRLLNNLTVAAQNATFSVGGTRTTMTDLFNGIRAGLPVLLAVELAYQKAGQAAKAANEDIAASHRAAQEAALSAGDAEQQIAQANVAAATQTKAAFAALKEDLGLAIKDLQEAAKGLGTLMSEQLASINTRVAERLAQLDKLRGSELANIQEAIEIERKGAAERLAVLQQSAAEILAIVDKMVEARRAAGKAQEEDAKTTELAIANIKKDGLQKIIAGFQAHVDRLLQIERGHLDKIRELQDQRTQISQSVEDRIRNIRLAGLSDYEKYNATLREIDKLTSQAREALAVGDLKAAETYAQKSIELASGISNQVTKDGEVVVSQFAAQETAIAKIKQGEALLLEANKQRTNAEIEGARASKTNLDTAFGQLQGLKGQLDSVNAIIKDGLRLEVRTETKSIDDAQRKINELKAPTSSTHTVRVVVENDTGVPLPDTSSDTPGFRRGGLVAAMRRAAQHFARGGPVFARPAWARVPGSGNYDTVPAALRSGEYVVRKAASQFYGDGLMARLARGFATGGPVAARMLATGGTDGPGAIVVGGKSRTGLSAGNADLRETFDRLFQLIDATRGLPRSSTGLNLGEWAARVIERLPGMDAKKKERVKNVVEEGFEGWMAAAETARKWRVPAVVDFNIASLAFRKGGYLGDLGKLAQAFARGGRAGGDTVPAMLTPGEYVVRKAAVSRFGVGFMDAINRMAVPREALAHMLTPPVPISRFAAGGPVGDVVTLGARGASSAAMPPITVNVHVDGRDLLDEGQIRRKVVPVISDIMRRGSQRLVEG